MESFHLDKLEALSALNNAAAEEAPSISPDSVDTLLQYVGGSWDPGYERGTLDATLFGGKLPFIQSEDLRSRLTEWERHLRTAEEFEMAQERFDLDVWTPFLRQNASMSQINNAQADIPGGVESYTTQTPVREVEDHTRLLRIREFTNMLQEWKYVSEDVLELYRVIVAPELNGLIAALEDEVAVRWGTS